MSGAHIRGKEYWQSEKANLIRLYQEENRRIPEIARMYHVCESTIRNQLKGFGIHIKRGAEARYNAKYNVNMHFFDQIDTEEKAWVLGFVLSDGHVSKKGHLMFAVQEGDIDILEKIKSAMQADAPITRKSNSPYYIFNISSEFLCRRLREIGLNNQKTEWFDFAKLLSNVPEELRHHLVRGMFDGDGSIRIYKYPYFKKHSYHFGYTGIKPVCDFIQGYFALGTKMADEGNGYWTCVSSNHSVILNAYDKMYRDATVYGNRKHNTYFQMKEICSKEFAA